MVQDDYIQANKQQNRRIQHYFAMMRDLGWLLMSIPVAYSILTVLYMLIIFLFDSDCGVIWQISSKCWRNYHQNS